MLVTRKETYHTAVLALGGESLDVNEKEESLPTEFRLERRAPR
jgi:hypothetical protein